MKDLLNENQMLEERILEHGDEVSLELFSEWRANRQKMGEHLADAAFCAIASRYDAYILSNPVNPSSYAHFTRPDVQSKTFTIQSRTLREGIRSGFLESEAGMRPLDFWIQGQRFYALERRGKEILAKDPAASDIPLTASCYEDSSLIVSDIDLVSIFLRNNSDAVLFDPTYGELTAEELEMVLDLNRYFQELVSKYFEFAAPSSFRLIAHGASNRFSKAKTSWLDRPMKLHGPQSSIQWLRGMEEFLDFNRKMKSLGYHVHLNPNWEF
ncbi:MAG: hypothetical protein JSR39_02445 [Verrucomicrobia bacterium]|nr:hypothetical protein [Verrucomicrobiota bacterium]